MRRRLDRLETERPDPGTAGMGGLSPADLARLLCERQRTACEAAVAASAAIGRAIRMAADALGRGGRILFVGAGTSGRLGVQEAAECVPTFGRIGRRVRAVIAGGGRALHGPVEGAEDRREPARAAIRRLKIGPDDLTVGISASRDTPFVAAALREARRRKGRTVLVACNPGRRPAWADHQIVLRTGPEPVAGSTRLKAGTATKIALNAITTGAMVRLGRVTGNRMTGLLPTSAKLRDRAVRLVAELAEVSPARARRLLESSRWDVGGAAAAARRRPPRRKRR